MLNWYNTGVTVELGELLDSGFPLWDFDYPVPRSIVEYNGKICTVDFDRERLQQKIVDHYRFREIGQETPARFKHYLKTKMLEIMPYYVQLYEFDAKFRNIEDPLESYNLMETFQQQTAGTGKITGTNTGTNSSNTNGSTTGATTGSTDRVNRFSDTPQGNIDNLDDHLTNATKDAATETGSSSTTSDTSTTETAQGTSEQNTQDSGTTSHTLTRRGNIGVQPLGGEVLNIRSAFINIDLQIIEELRDLFMQIY